VSHKATTAVFADIAKSDLLTVKLQNLALMCMHRPIRVFVESFVKLVKGKEPK